MGKVPVQPDIRRKFINPATAPGSHRRQHPKTPIGAWANRLALRCAMSLENAKDFEDIKASGIFGSKAGRRLHLS